MDDIISMVTLVKEIGIPSLFFLVIIYIIFKTVPDLIKSKREGEVKQQEYYSQRQKQYDEQMAVLIKVAEQGNQVISRSNEVIGMNTRVIEQNTAIHDKVSAALSRDLEALKNLSADLKKHDERSQDIYHDVTRLLERSS